MFLKSNYLTIKMNIHSNKFNVSSTVDVFQILEIIFCKKYILTKKLDFLLII